MSGFDGRVAVVTGAGSGIGRALALDLARRGARLALSDVDEQGLAETARLAAGEAGTRGDVHTSRLDVSQADAVTAYAGEVLERFGAVNQVYNNAGIAFSRKVEESELADYGHVLGVNLWGVIHGTTAFLPHLIASGEGHVVNVSSLNGFMAQGGMSHYVTSKFAVRGFTETLRIEMLEAGHPVQVSVVHPGGIKTNISSSALEEAKASGRPVTAADEARAKLYDEKLLKMPPEDAARTILDGVRANKPRILVGNDAKAVDVLVRALPATYAKAVVAQSRRLG